MEIKEVVASIKIGLPIEGRRKIDVTMSIWKEPLNNGNILIKLSFFGGITTVAENEADCDRAVVETLTCFFQAISKSPNGFAQELKSLGWQAKRNSFRIKKSRPLSNLKPESWAVENHNPIFKEMIKTGVNKSFSLDL